MLSFPLNGAIYTSSRKVSAVCTVTTVLPFCLFIRQIWVALGQWFAPYPIKLALYGGALLTYVAYDLTHYFLHFGTAFSDQTRKMKVGITFASETYMLSL